MYMSLRWIGYQPWRSLVHSHILFWKVVGFILWWRCFHCSFWSCCSLTMTWRWWMLLNQLVLPSLFSRIQVVGRASFFFFWVILSIVRVSKQVSPYFSMMYSLIELSDSERSFGKDCVITLVEPVWTSEYGCDERSSLLAFSCWVFSDSVWR